MHPSLKVRTDEVIPCYRTVYVLQQIRAIGTNIAVCNKLLKQAFAIAKSGVEYNKNHRVNW